MKVTFFLTTEDTMVYSNQFRKRKKKTISTCEINLLYLRSVLQAEEPVEARVVTHAVYKNENQN